MVSLDVQINILTSENLNTAIEKTIIKARDVAACGNTPVLIVVPDRFTLQCERILMQDVRALLNVRVVTFSMLFNIISDELNAESEENKILDKTAAVLHMWNAIQNVGDQLVWFNKSVGHYAFAEKMFNAINQLISSMVLDWDSLPKKATAEITHKKMHDVVLIREEYKKLTASYTDGSSMLGYLIENVKHSKLIKDAKIFITGFEYLSVQRSAVVLELANSASEITFGVRNKSEISDFLVEYVFNNKIRNDVTSLKGKVAGNDLLDIFSNDSLKTEDCVCCHFANAQEEAAWVANQIARLVKKQDVRLGDVVVALGDYDHTVKIFEQTFTQNGIFVNADVGVALLDLPIALFVQGMLLLANNGKCEHIIAAAKSMYSGLSREEEFEFENFCLKHNASISLLGREVAEPNDVLRTAIEKFNLRIALFANKLSRCKTVEEISNQLLQVIENTKLQDFEDEPLENAATEKIVKLLATCAEVLGARQMTLQEFANMFGTLAAATKVSKVPTSADAVTLVSAKEYESSFVPYLFVCGCNNGVFPVEQDDTDIITEFDISNMKTTIEPTATMQNNRARVHAVNILSSFTEKLFITYTTLNTSGEQGRPSEIIERMKNFHCETAQGENLVNELFCRSWAASAVLFSVADGTAFSDAITYNSILKSVDPKGVLIPEFAKLPQPLSNARELFFKNSAARVTQFENFYKCPYYHFLQNGLKIRPRETVRAAASVIGSLIHKVVELFLNCVIEKGLELDVPAEMKKCVTETLSMKRFAYFANEPINKPIIANIKKQAQKIGKSLIVNIKAGSYRPRFLEKYFEQQIGGELTCRGIADRIDAAEIDGSKNALVIDYKTGGNSGFSYKQLYLGTKLQLPLYMKALSGDYLLGGACYLPLQGGFNGGSSGEIKMSGIVLNTFENATALDGGLAVPYKSGIVPLSNRAGKIMYGVTQEQLTSVIDYASAMIENAVSQISEGHIAPSPFDKKVCEYCICSAMCMHKTETRGSGLPVQMNIKNIGQAMQGGGGGESDD